MRSERGLAVFLACALLMVCFGGAQAAPLGKGVRPRAARHCATQPVPTGGRAVVWCFDSQREADAAMRARASSSATKMAIMYEDSNLGGSTLTIYENSSLGWCAGSGNIPSWFNDSTSSVRSYCPGLTLYTDTYEGGPSQFFGTGAYNVASWMNDEASSYSFSR